MLQRVCEHHGALAPGTLLLTGNVFDLFHRPEGENIGDYVTLVDLPPVGTAVKADERFGDIESVKTVSELFSPVSGEVVEINEALEASPELVNEAPYQGGWMVRIKLTDGSDTGALLDAAGYEAYLGELDD